VSSPKPSSGRRLTTLLLGALSALLVVSIIAYPDQAFAASLQGLTVWWKYVFPALLPYLMLTEMLLGFGVVHALGTLLSPIMRALFGIPGAGGAALAMGLAVGQPAGARASAALRKQGHLTRGEAERLLSLSHVSSPYFIITIIGVGFLHSARFGLMLAAVHYAALLAAGLTLRLLPNPPDRLEPQQQSEHPIIAAVAPAGVAPTRGSLLRRAFAEMHDAHTKDGRAFGKLLGDAVASTVQSLMMVGGYMIMFSVVVQICEITKATAYLQGAVAYILGSDSFHAAVRGFVGGLFEIHIGSYSLSGQAGLVGAPLAAAVAAALGWGGLSSHAQAKGLAHDAKLRYRPFLTVRLLHAAYSFLLAYALWNPLAGSLGAAPSSAGENAAPLAAAPAYPGLLSACFAVAIAVAAMAACAELWRLFAQHRRKPL
jgi:sporulation integral membrane protein YlbJ